MTISRLLKYLPFNATHYTVKTRICIRWLAHV